MLLVTVQTIGVEDDTATGNPDVALGVIVREEDANVRVPGF